MALRSHASNFLLKRNFGDAQSASPFGYSISPSDRPVLPRHEQTWFERYRCTAIPGIFAHTLESLQSSFDFPFLAQWEHDWGWIQSTNPRPQPDPHYFIGVGRHGPIDISLRETYASAYLRTLAHAALLGAISHDQAEEQSLLTLTMNRGLADLEPIERPQWSQLSLPIEAQDTRIIARKLWGSARMAAANGETLVSLQVFDHDADSFVEFEIVETVNRRGSAIDPAKVSPLESIEPMGDRGMMAGLARPTERDCPTGTLGPRRVVRMVIPKGLGCVHRETALSVRLACPDLFRARAEIRCGPTDIRLESDEGVFSRWVHWYSDWEPSTFRDVNCSISGMTTVTNAYVGRLRFYVDSETKTLVRVRRGIGRKYQSKTEVEETAFWM